MLQWETGTFSLLFCHDRITWFKSLFYIGWITCHLGKENQKYCAFLRPKCKKQGMERPHQPLQPLFCVVFTVFRAIFPHKRRKSLFSLGRQKRFFLAGAEGLEVALQPLLRCPKSAGAPVGAADFDRCANPCPCIRRRRRAQALPGTWCGCLTAKCYLKTAFSSRLLRLFNKTKRW